MAIEHLTLTANRSKNLLITLDMTIKYSIVIPVKDEVETIYPCFSELEGVMNQISESWEVIIVDDGSTDGTIDLLNALVREKNTLSVLSFPFNLGQTHALNAGFKKAKGEMIITLDGDGQNDPHDIPLLIESLQGMDMVCGKRVRREDSFLKIVQSRVANFIRRKVCQDGISDSGCALKLFRARCLSEIKLFKGMHRFLPTLFQMEGFKVIEINVNHRRREKGRSKYHFGNRSLNTLFDLFAVAWMRKRSLKR